MTSIMTLRHTHRPEPDVPEDVALLHLNDPNWDLSPPTYSSDSLDIEEKPSDTAYSSGFSARDSDFDTDSQTGSVEKSAFSRLQLREADQGFNDDSPYAEVRAAVSNVDDPTMPVNTFRMWLIGIVFSFVIAGANHILSMRFPSSAITNVMVQLLALPAGRFLAWALPTTRFNTFGYIWSLNPGPFNIKEHTVITVMANIITVDAYGTAVTMMQSAFYGQKLSFGYNFCLILSTQMIGYAFAGVTRQFLVWPTSMIWPGALVECALLNTLHRTYDLKERKHMNRFNFFFLVAAAGALYFFVPGFLFTGLSMFSWVCWIAPENQVVNTLFGYSTGLGMGFLTFDWSMISWVSDPLVSPWWSELNVFAGFVFFMWILTPILYFKNVFFSKFMPVSAAIAFDNTGAPYDVTAILNDEGIFDEEKYKAYSPLYMPTAFAMAYAAEFASFTSMIVHVFLWYRRDIFHLMRRSSREERDVHSRLMSVYKEVPWWWYAGLGIISVAFGIAAIEIFPTQMPVWALLLCVVISFLFVIPTGIIRAVSNQLIATNVFSEFIGGYVLPGRPVAVMLFKTYGFLPTTQALSFASDLKIGHYMKIPPRIMFMAQTVATIISSFAVVGAQQWALANIENVCTPLAKNGFTCPPVSTFATTSIIWGAIGPKRMFSPGALYNPLLYFYLIGALIPIPCYLLARKYPRSFWRYINIPLVFAGVTSMPPATGINYSSWIAVGFVFQWFIRRFHFQWWMRYNYILAAALDCGVVIGAFAVFLLLNLPRGGVTLDWWGNTVWQKTFDAMGMPAKLVDPGTIFGLQTWS
ncbi:OPT oligopeptide transporter [Abortiporus biennis]|nr:OPT oligopeptide transporter [Abortiporus biennis]